MPEQFGAVVVDEGAEHAVIRVVGELDMVTARQLHRIVVEALGTGHRHLVFDLSGLTFCDCAGLGVLLAAGHRAVDQGGTAVLLRPSSPFVRLLDLAQCGRPLPVYESLAEVPALR